MSTTRNASTTTPRGPYKKPRLTEMQETMKNTLLDVAVQKLIEERTKRKGQCSTGFMELLLNDLRSNAVLSDATMYTIYNHKKKLDKIASSTPQPLQQRPQITPTIQPPQFNDNDAAAKVTPSPANHGGRSKGLSNEERIIRKKAYESAMELATTEYQKEISSTKSGKLPRGRLNEIIKSAMKECKVHPSTPLNAETIRTRAKRGNPSGRQKTPMEKIEPYLIAMCLERHKVNQPFSEAQFLEFANSLIQGTDTLQNVIKNKKTAKLPVELEKALGAKYYRNFMERNKLFLESAKAYNKDVHRANWSTYANFDYLYNYVYENFVDVGIAKKLPHTVFKNREGNTVECEEDSCK